MTEIRISRNRLEGFKNVKRKQDKLFREKLSFNSWFNNGIERCRYQGANVFVDLEYRQVIIRWSEENVVLRTIDDMYIEYRDEYCTQWRS